MLVYVQFLMPAVQVIFLLPLGIPVTDTTSNWTPLVLALVATMSIAFWYLPGVGAAAAYRRSPRLGIRRCVRACAGTCPDGCPGCAAAAAAAATSPRRFRAQIPGSSFRVQAPLPSGASTWSEPSVFKVHLVCRSHEIL